MRDREQKQRQERREDERGLTITVHYVEEWEDGRPAEMRRREDKAREDLLKADNEGVIRSEIAYRRSTNSSPHARPYSTVLHKMVRMHTHHGSGEKWDIKRIRAPQERITRCGEGSR